jgi:thiol-disulfide isomerase/thioredoxin
MKDKTKSTKTMKTIALACVALAGASLECAAQSPAAKSAFTNDTGWVWHMPPAEADWSLITHEGLVLRLDELKDDRLLLTMSHAYPLPGGVIQMRPVAFDKAGRRYEMSVESGAGEVGVFMQSFTLSGLVLPRERIAHIGMEKLTEDNMKGILAPRAFRQLKEAGEQALGWPVIGKRYDFELTTVDGKKLTSGDFAGKVVLLDFWALWCGPCMKKMRRLKEIYSRHHAQGFEVIGINHDWSLAEACRVIAREQLPWPNVLAPVSRDRREQWQAASGAFALPRLLLLDRRGVLREMAGPDKLETAVTKLMEER